MGKDANSFENIKRWEVCWLNCWIMGALGTGVCSGVSSEGGGGGGGGEEGGGGGIGEGGGGGGRVEFGS